MWAQLLLITLQWLLRWLSCLLSGFPQKWNKAVTLSVLTSTLAISQLMTMPASEPQEVGTERPPKEEAFGPDTPRTPRGHSCRRPGPIISVRPSKSWKSKHSGADIDEPTVPTFMTRGGSEKPPSEKLQADSSSLWNVKDFMCFQACFGRNQHWDYSMFQSLNIHT